MIAILLSQLQFEYDIHSLVKAFYPAHTIKIFSWEEAENILPEQYSPMIAVIFGEKEIVVSVNAKTITIPKTQIIYNNIPETKNHLKRVLYDTLNKNTQKTLPWGTLTGIRPTKIPLSLLEAGKSEADILAYLQQTYYVSEEKGALSILVAKKEREILSQIHYREGYSLYIGIPFCPTTCLYCSFTSYPIALWAKRVDDYLEALEKEMDYVANAYRHKLLDTIYIGGGTPTTLNAIQLERLLTSIRAKFSLEHVKEFCVEAGRADSITLDKLKVMKQNGVNRISVNPQTMKEETLRIIGRKHSVKQVREAFFMAREEGFSNINMDFILGLPGEDAKDVAATMEAMKVMKPDSITIHSLAVKRGSKLNDWILENGRADLQNTEETMQITMDAAKEMGMHPYYLYRQKNMSGNFENVGYATDGKDGIYNILIMEEKQSIVALGAGSISKVVLEQNRIERCDNVKDVGLYIDRIEEMIDRKKKLFGI